MNKQIFPDKITAGLGLSNTIDDENEQTKVKHKSKLKRKKAKKTKWSKS